MNKVYGCSPHDGGGGPRSSNSLDEGLALATEFERMSFVDSRTLLKKVRAHTDDIHVLRIVDHKGNFVTGSKDGSIRGWSRHGSLLQDLCAPTKIGRSGHHNQLWICSAGLKFRHSHFDPAQALQTQQQRVPLFFGCRDGTMEVFSFDESSKAYARSTSFPFSAPRETKCKQRNLNRIMAIEHFEDDTYLVGLPGSVHLFQYPSQHTASEDIWLKSREPSHLKVFIADSNDWIYAIRRLEDHKFAIVAGDSLHLWTFDIHSAGGVAVEKQHALSSRPERSARLSRKKKGEGAPPDQISGMTFSSRNRPYISSLDYMKGGCEIVMGRFDEAIVTLQVDRADSPQIRKRCHRGRIWEVKYLSTSTILSAGEDGFIRLWDLRVKGGRAQAELGAHSGRVSQFEIMNQTSLVSAACPKRPTASDAGSLYFWDLRKM